MDDLQKRHSQLEKHWCDAIQNFSDDLITNSQRTLNYKSSKRVKFWVMLSYLWKWGCGCLYRARASFSPSAIPSTFHNRFHNKHTVIMQGKECRDSHLQLLISWQRCHTSIVLRKKDFGESFSSPDNIRRVVGRTYCCRFVIHLVIYKWVYVWKH